MRVRKAVIPVAGLGTMFLPATRAILGQKFEAYLKEVIANL